MYQVALPPTYEGDIESYAGDLHTFLASYPLFVYGFHLFDFFEQGIWNDASIPKDWKCFIDENIQSTEQLKEWISEAKDVFLLNSPPPATWPPSLVDFLSMTRNLALPRYAATQSFGDLIDINSLPPIPDDQQCSKAHMSRKKHHESERLAQLVQSMVHKTQADLIIDIGAGQGYLTYLLANIAPVLAAESVESRTHGAQERHAKLPPSAFTIRYTTQYLTEDNIGDLIGEATRVIVVGLHACGDLGGKVLLGLLRQPSVVGIASVGCCYQMMDTNAWPLCSSGSVAPLPVTQQSFSLACQTYNAKPDLDLHVSMRGFHNRALFQSALNTITPENKENTKHAMQVGEAWQDAVRRHAGVGPTTETAITQTSESYDTPRETARIAFASLIKARFGPLIESAILLDRVRYAAQCVPSRAPATQPPIQHVGLGMLFDQHISPRNAVVWAWRQ